MLCNSIISQVSQIIIKISFKRTVYAQRSFLRKTTSLSQDVASHHGAPITTEEDLAAILENTVVLLWLQMIHLGLSQLNKQKYSADPCKKSLADIKPEISQALTSLLDKLRCIDDTKAMRTITSNVGRYPLSKSQDP